MTINRQQPVAIKFIHPKLMELPRMLSLHDYNNFHRLLPIQQVNSMQMYAAIIVDCKFA